MAPRRRSSRRGSSGWRLCRSIRRNSPIRAADPARDADHRRGSPSGRLGLADTEDQQTDPGGDGHRSRQVELARPGAARLIRQPGQSTDDGHHADRTVDQEDRPPSEGGGEHPPEQEPDHAAERAGRRPDGVGPIAQASFSKRRGEDGQGGRRDDRGGQTLGGPAGHQLDGRGRGGRAQRRHGEGRHPADEQTPATVQVGEPATEQQEAAKGQGIGGQRPLQGGGGEPERLLDVRIGDGHDGDVDGQDQLAAAQDGQDATVTLEAPLPHSGAGFRGRQESSPPIGNGSYPRGPRPPGGRRAGRRPPTRVLWLT